MLGTIRKWMMCGLVLLSATTSAYSAPKTVLVVGDRLSAE